jgi:competence protein ComEC
MAAGIILADINNWYLTLTVVIAIFLIYLADKKAARQVMIGLIVTVISFAYFNLMVIKPPNELPVLKNTSLTGMVISYPVVDEGKTSFILRAESPNIYCDQVRVVTYYRANVHKGDKVNLKGDLKPPPPPSNPGEFDYPDYLANNGIFYVLSVKTGNNLSIISHQEGLQKWIDSYRNRAERLFYHELTNQEAGIILGMLLGKLDGMDPEQYQDFQKTGIIHIFSVGGMHVGFLLLLSGWIMSLFKRSNRAKMFMGVCLLILYGTMIGWPLPVVRSVVMAVMGLIAYYAGRENSMVNALAISGIVILLVNPCSLFLISFQLTFLATFGLVYIYPTIRKAIKAEGSWKDIILVPLCAEVAVLPLVAVYFNMFSAVSLLTNIITTYLTGGVVILGFIAFILTGISSTIAALFLYPAGLFIDLILMLVEYMKILPGAYIWVATPLIWIVILYYLALLVFLKAISSGSRRWAAGSITVIFMIIASFYIPPSWYNRGQMEVVFIDVGQGDSILIKTPRGKFILIDGGGSQFYDVGSLKVLSYLHHRGINRLYMMINSHPDVDHLLGLETVFKETPVKLVGIPAGLDKAHEYNPIELLAQKQRIPVIPLHQGQVINLEKDVTASVLMPNDARYQTNNYNNHSLVLRIDYGNFSALFTGDIEEEAINNLLSSNNLTHATVIKVPHHGSKNSAVAGLYELTSPDYAVIPVGRDNDFGHPHPSAIKLLKNQNIKVLRTDENGAISFVTDGKNIKLITFFPILNNKP